MTSHFVLEIGKEGLKLQASAPKILLGKHGAIFGHLFSRTQLDRRVLQLGPAEIAAIVDSSGRSLIQDYWGGYVAAISRDDGSHIVLRDPSGIMPCYWSVSDGQILCSNDIEDAACFGGPARVDLAALTHYLASPGYNGDLTGLAGTSELPAGCALVVGASKTTVTEYWSPWDHVARKRDLTFLQAANELEETVRSCIAAWANCFDNILLGVSGGLDSSIVATIAAPYAKVTCLTMYADDAEGDERSYARALTNHLQLDLLTGRFRIEDIDIGAAVTPHRPWPNVTQFALGNERRHRELEQVDAYFSGNGGDNIFCATRSTSPFLDRLLVEGPGGGLKATLRDLCLLTETDAGTVLKAAWQQYFRSRKGPAPKIDLSGLAPTACPSSPLQHPWKKAPKDALIGKMGHVGFLAGAQQSHELYSRRSHPPHIAPLLSQPIVELCLSIPTWFWVQGGVDRAVARSAFRNSLPDPVVNRASKGGPGMFVQEIYRQNAALIKDMVSEGTLAKRGFIDRDYVLAKDDLSWRGNAKAQRLLQFAGAETWCRYWEGRATPSTC